MLLQGMLMPTTNGTAPKKRSPLATWLRDQVAQRGWTQTEFAEAVGVSQGTASKWLLGTMDPTPESMQRIADAFFVSLDDVLAAAGIRPIVVHDPPQITRILHKLRRIDPSVERFAMIEATLDVMLEADEARAEGVRRRRKLAES